MKTMSAIAAVGKNWELGKDGELLYNYQPDLAHFKRYTMGKTVIVGAKTYLSMPPLPGRKVICICKEFTGVKLKQKGDRFIQIRERDRYNYGLLMLIEHAAEGREIVLAGGGYTYHMFARCVTELCLTRINMDFEDADTYFPHADYGALLKLTPSRKEMFLDGSSVEIYKGMC